MMNEADLLISDLAARYGAMTTYRDRGVVLQPLGENEAAIRTTFETRFRRPGMFRFSFATPHPYPPLAHLVTEYCFGSDSSGAYAWTKEHGGPAHISRQEDLSMAIAGATGISGGSAHTIGALLMPGIGGRTFPKLHDFRIRGREALEGLDCVVAEAPYPNGAEVAVWIHRDTMTLRKLRTKHPSLPAGEEIRSDIEIDVVIDDRELSRPA